MFREQMRGGTAPVARSGRLVYLRGMSTTFSHLIGGAFVPGTRHFDVIDPATGEAFATCPDASRGQVDAAMDAAARAFAGTWSRDEALRRRTLAHMSEVLSAKA